MLDPKVINDYADLADCVIKEPAETASVRDIVWVPTGDGTITKYEDPGVIDYALKSAAAITALLAERKELQDKYKNLENMYVSICAQLEDVDRALDGLEVSDFSESFPCVQKAVDLRAELLRWQPVSKIGQVTGCPDCKVTNLTMAGDTGVVSCVQCGRVLWSPKEKQNE